MAGCLICSNCGAGLRTEDSVNRAMVVAETCELGLSSSDCGIAGIGRSHVYRFIVIVVRITVSVEVVGIPVPEAVTEAPEPAVEIMVMPTIPAMLPISVVAC